MWVKKSFPLDHHERYRYYIQQPSYIERFYYYDEICQLNDVKGRHLYYDEVYLYYKPTFSRPKTPTYNRKLFSPKSVKSPPRYVKKGQSPTSSNESSSNKDTVRVFNFESMQNSDDSVDGYTTPPIESDKRTKNPPAPPMKKKTQGSQTDSDNKKPTVIELNFIIDSTNDSRDGEGRTGNGDGNGTDNDSVNDPDNPDENLIENQEDIDEVTRKIESDIASLIIVNQVLNRLKDSSMSSGDNGGNADEQQSPTNESDTTKTDGSSSNDTKNSGTNTEGKNLFSFPFILPNALGGNSGNGNSGFGFTFNPTSIKKKRLPIQWTDEEEAYEFQLLDERADTIDDLIRIGKQYKEKYEPMKKRFNLNVRVLATLVEPLEELQKMVGMEKIKTAIYEKIILYLQGIENRNRDFLHTVLYGGPGMGKTEVAKLIGRIYAKMGLLSKGDFKEIRLTDLKAGYVGQSELKTQKVLDDARGCVLFMDEAYSLGSEEKMDQFSQGIIDLINPYMDKYKDDFVFIIAGYRDELEHRFFRGNQGLKSRFGLWLEIDEYKGAELREIFLKKVRDYEWTIDASGISVEFFEKNRKSFPFFGRDVENLFSKCKIAHAKRVLYMMPEDKKKVTLSDLEEGFKIYMKDRTSTKDDEAFEQIKKMMYM